MHQETVKFSSQANSKLLDELKRISKQEGKLFQVIIEEAFKDFVEKKKQEKPRSSVLGAFEKSLNEYDNLYRNLAK